MSYSCIMREEVVGGSRTGAGVSLPMGRKGSRFAFMKTGWGSGRVGERLMLCTRCMSLDSPDMDASAGSEKDDSHMEMMSVLRFSTWFVLTLYMPKPNLVRKSSARDFRSCSGVGGEGRRAGGGMTLCWLAHRS